MAHQGYDNLMGRGDFASLLLGDVNLDGRVTDADRVALLAGAADLGVDTSRWAATPEPGTWAMIVSAFTCGVLVRHFRHPFGHVAGSERRLAPH